MGGSTVTHVANEDTAFILLHTHALGTFSLLPKPSTHVKRVWCSEQHFLSHGVGLTPDLRSPIRCSGRNNWMFAWCTRS